MQVPTLAAVGISYWTASLPLGAQLAERLRATSGQNIGAGAVASVDEADETEEEQEVYVTRLPFFLFEAIQA